MTADSASRLATALASRYRIDGELGRGGTATVYLAHDIKHGRDVAIKVLSSDLSQALNTERFLREIRLAAKLSHPHILPLFDSGDADGALYYVMPRVSGHSLRDRLKHSPQLSIEDAVRIASEVAGALDYAHRQRIVHRDIKPENILLQDGHALVADFGIGKALSAMSDDSFTQSGMSVGTPAYMSPEQAAGDDIDGRSDLYSLGCVLYEMLVGEPPFTGTTAQAVIARRFVHTPGDVALLRGGVSRPVSRAVQKVLQRIPMDRYDSGNQFIAALTETDTRAIGAHAPPEKSIAVLAFENLSSDRENEYFGDGVAEDLINALSRARGLHVAARMSAFSFKGKQQDLQVVGESLHVATVLVGSVRKSGNRVRITAQLLNVADGYQLWSERFDRELVDVFAVQEEIASAIAERLQLTFARTDETALRATTAEVESYELLVRGRALAAQRGRQILAAIDCFELAIALAPDSAEACAALGNAYRVKAQYGFGTMAECHPLGRAALMRALELDPENAEATGYLAIYKLNEEVQDPSEALALFERALALDPRLSEIRGLYAGWGLAIAGQGALDERAEREVRRSLADDPLNVICSTIFAIVLGGLGQAAEGAAEAKRACERDPAAFGPRYALAWTQTWARQTEAGLATVNDAMEQFGRHPWFLQVLTGLLVQRGDRTRAEAVHAELEARAISGGMPAFSLAVSALYLGRVDQAMDFAIRSARSRDAIGPIWLRWPDIAALQAHARYGELLAAMTM